MSIRAVSRRRRPGLRQVIQGYARTTYNEAILEAAERLFLRTGFQDAKMVDLAAEAGIAIGTLYRYFPSKEAVFASLAARAQEQIVAIVDSTQAVGDAVERLRGMVKDLCAYVERRGGLWAVHAELGWAAGAQFRKSSLERVPQTQERVVCALEKLFREGIEQQRIRADASPTLLATAFAGAMHSTLCAWVRAKRRDDSLAARTSALLDLFLEGAGVK